VGRGVRRDHRNRARPVGIVGLLGVDSARPGERRQGCAFRPKARGAMN
jgi:hypothetical protein